jgi:hypothetical protein
MDDRPFGFASAKHEGKEYAIELTHSRYGDGTPVVNGYIDGERWCTLSVCVPYFEEDYPALGWREFLAKGWSENESFYKACVAAGLIVPTPTRVPTGFVEAVIVEIPEHIELKAR